MSRIAVDHYLWLMHEAFEGDRHHSLLGNLGSVRPQDWYALPDGAERTIAHIAQHAGYCKYMYENHAFGDRSYQWDEPPFAPLWPPDFVAGYEAYLRDGHERLVRSVSALDDAALIAPSWAPWESLAAGGTPPTAREVIAKMIEHDLYHSGEINRTRALLQRSEDA